MGIIQDFLPYYSLTTQHDEQIPTSENVASNIIESSLHRVFDFVVKFTIQTFDRRLLMHSGHWNSPITRPIKIWRLPIPM